jgi:TolB-like protein/tetratricopeptide (TPR) repeat protein
MQGQPLTFGPFSYDDATGTLWRNGNPVALGGRAMAVLAALLAANGNVVPREALIEAGWGGAVVEDGNLAVQIAGLRKILGPRDDGQEWIATVPRVGYRLPRDVPLNSSGKASLVVLPFINMSGDPGQEHIADGMVEDLITMFSRFRNLSVIARQSSFLYKDRQFDIRDAARALGVRYLIEGSVRRAGDRVRVTAQLIDGASGEHIWAEKLDGKVDDVFDFQDRITSGVIGLIEPRIRTAEIERARRKHPQNLDAYDLYWRALPLMQSSQGSLYTEAVDLLDQAVALESNFAPILALAASAHQKRRSWGRSPPGVDDAAIGRALAVRAMEADPNDPSVLLVNAGAIYRDGKGELEPALALARQAYALNPNSGIICISTGWFEWVAGNYDAALACALRALEISPGTSERFWSLNSIARDHLSAGRIEEALVWALRTIEANPELEEARATAAACYALLGEGKEAKSALAALVAINPKVTLADLASKFGNAHYRHLREGLATLETADTPKRPAHSPA